MWNTTDEDWREFLISISADVLMLARHLDGTAEAV